MKDTLRAKRRHDTETYIARQNRIRKFHRLDEEKQPHRYAKRSSMTCGNSNCVMCGNPRKFWGNLTHQELAFPTTEDWYEAEDQTEEATQPDCCLYDGSEAR